jgi:NAD(P)-dependent dehydrogenase (short-subunit alcohol dehydrogenase family)
MSVDLKRIHDQVMVITGATSGIGLTTARMASERGARIVAAARNDDAVRQLADEINGSGGQAIGVATDVSNQEEVRRLAQAAIERFGGFDTWVNDAGVSIFGEIMDVPVEDERKLFETNYWGVVYGSRCAVEHMQTRGGCLINIGSVTSDRAVPLQGAYSASKHAVKAYTDTLRMELEHNGVPISVTLIKPTAIATPFFEKAKVYMDAEPTEPSPMYAPNEVARAILHAAENPVRDLLVGDNAPLQSALGRYAPGLGDRVMGSMMFEGQKSDRPARQSDHAALDRPSSNLRERAEYDAMVLERSLYTRAAMHPILAGAIAAGASFAIAMMLGGEERRSARGRSRS